VALVIQDDGLGFVLVAVEETGNDTLGMIGVDHLPLIVELISEDFFVRRGIEITVFDGDPGAPVVPEAGDVIGFPVSVGVAETKDAFAIFGVVEFYVHVALFGYDQVPGCAQPIGNHDGVEARGEF
jgi:hypothetical protein